MGDENLQFRRSPDLAAEVVSDLSVASHGDAPATLFFPFVDELEFRTREEKVHDEIYRSIPALNHLVTSALNVTNKIPLEARNAILLQDGKIDPALRVLKVEVGLVKRHEMENAQPDMDYLAGAKPASRKEFESKDNDPWIEP